MASNIMSRGVVVTRAADLKPQKLARVWHGRFFLGKIGIIAGEPGLGKSQIAAFMAAMVSTGGDWPFDEGTSRRGDVIYISAEDGAADTIRPRLEAAGADLDRVHIIEGVNDELGRRPFNLVTDLGNLSMLLRQVRKPRLVIVDPINACLSSTDVHRFNPNSVIAGARVARRPKHLADRHRVAVVCRHTFHEGEWRKRPIAGDGFVCLCRRGAIRVHGRTQDWTIQSNGSLRPRRTISARDVAIPWHFESRNGLRPAKSSPLMPYSSRANFDRNWIW